jgi:small conductance mechanosensitive channel
MGAREMAIENPLESEFQRAELIYEKLIQFFVEYSMQVVGAIIILFIGYIVANKISQWITNFLIKKELDITLSQLIGSISYFAILFCFVVIALGKFGISITPFIAALGAFTLGAGLAIQGIVSNYGAGFSIIFSRPFVVGNTLTVQHVSGVVEEIRLAYTVLKTEDNERITIPNKEIIGQILENSFAYKLVDSDLTIEPASDPRRAVNLLAERLNNMDCVSDEPGVQVGIDGFTPLGIRLGIRCWVPTATYYESKYQVNAEIFDALSAGGIKLSTPRQEVRMIEAA